MVGWFPGKCLSSFLSPFSSSSLSSFSHLSCDFLSETVDDDLVLGSSDLAVSSVRNLVVYFPAG